MKYLTQAGDFHVKGHEGKDGFTFGIIFNRPASKGFMRLQSANPFQQPMIDPQYLHDEADVNSFLDGGSLSVHLFLI